MSHETMTRVLDQVDDSIVAAMNEHALVGIGVAVIHGGEPVYAKGFGLANVKQQRSVTSDTVFRIGSITKTLTAIGLMQLWEQGAFQLDDPVNEYLKWYKIEHSFVSAPPVTFRHLLTHTSGIGELRSLRDMFRPVLGLVAKPDKPAPPLWQYYAGGMKAELYPDMKFAYSNHAFATLGQLIEDISGEAFEDYMLKHVCQPLGMMHTSYDVGKSDGEQLAQGYALAKNKVISIPYMEVIPKGAGAVASTVNDMAAYVAALLAGGGNQHGRVLKPETLAMMMERHYAIDEPLPALGLSFWVDSLYGHRIVEHSGGLPGFVSAMYLAPDEDVGVVVCSNTNSLAPVMIAKDVLRQCLGISDSQWLSPARDVLTSPHVWSEICGFYGTDKGLNTNARIWALLGGEVEVFVEDNQLKIRTLVGPLRKGAKLYPVDKTDPLVFQLDPDAKFIWPPGLVTHPLTVMFKRTITGQVDRLCAGFTTLYKRPRMQSVQFKAMVGLGALTGLTWAALRGWNKRREDG